MIAAVVSLRADLGALPDGLGALPDDVDGLSDDVSWKTAGFCILLLTFF